MILISDVHMVTGPYVVSNGDREVTHDAASSANQAPVSYRHDDV
jgi:hypothetical protein